MSEIILPYPHEGQQKVRNNAKRFNFLSAGRRWRKTTLVMAIAVEAATTKRQNIVWGAPTYDQVEVGFKETKRAAGDYAKFNSSKMLVEFPGAGSIVYRSLDDPDNARGHTADGVVVDESGDVPEIAWYEVLRPMLMDTDGWAWLIGTPKGRNWYWREHIKTIDRPFDSNAWQVPSLGCEIVNNKLVRKHHPLENPNLKFSEIEQLFETMPERTFRQEILAEFIEDAGGVFRGVRKIANGKRMQPYPGRFGAGIDWGKQNDFTFISIFDQSNGKMVDFDRFNKIDWYFQRERLKVMFAKWKPFMGVAERNSIGDPNIEALQREGLPIVGFDTTATSKPPLIESWGLAIERGETELINDPVIVAEHEAYERTVSTVTGRSRYGAPEGMHDDTVVGSALGWHAITQGKVFRAVVGGQRPVVQTYIPR